MSSTHYDKYDVQLNETNLKIAGLYFSIIFFNKYNPAIFKLVSFICT